LSRRYLPCIALLLAASLVPATAAAQYGGTSTILRMPGKSHTGPLPALSAREEALAAAFRADVERLAGTIGERNVDRYLKLVEAARFLETSLAAAGYEVERQEYAVRGRTCWNIVVSLPAAAESPRAEEIIVVGAHYDSVRGSPGANDNGSGTVAVLALARSMAGTRAARTLRFVLFVNEEQPYFQSESMGSYVYAKACKARGENVVAMLSLETIGYYSDAAGSQRYPSSYAAYYPSTGNFVGFVGNTQSGRLVTRVVESFRRNAAFPSEGGALPGHVDGVGWSDHWAFWQFGYPAVMVTDTALFRYPYYHSPRDTPDKLDYDRMARIVAGLEKVIADLATPPEPGPADAASATQVEPPSASPPPPTRSAPSRRGFFFRRRR
jgi:hypothetical protein